MAADCECTHRIEENHYMQKLILIIVTSLLLSSCAIFRVHKMDIEQGNVITPEMVSRVHVGMSEGQVKEIMGEPVLITTFENDQLNYIYTLQPAYHDMQEKRLVLMIRHGRVRDIIQ